MNIECLVDDSYGKIRNLMVPRHFQWEGGLDGHWMMPCDDTRGHIWTIAGAW